MPPEGLEYVPFPFQLVISEEVMPAAADALKTGSVSVYPVIKPLSFVRSLVFVGMVVVSGRAPTSDAVYVGLLDAFAQEGTVGSVSV